MTLEVAGLAKRFGRVVALDGLSMAAPAGHVMGFLGSNGAGKTTTMRIALGVLRADGGTIRWNGTDHRDLPRPTWGYLPEGAVSTRR
jgi:ABC-2 type transport system ATP-binding protein